MYIIIIINIIIIIIIVIIIIINIIIIKSIIIIVIIIIIKSNERLKPRVHRVIYISSSMAINETDRICGGRKEKSMCKCLPI